MIKIKNVYGSLSLGSLVGLLYATLVVAGNFHKWTDDKGIIHYGDHVPPEFAQKEQAEVNKYGLTVGVTSAAKTQEQLAEDQRQAVIQAAAHRQIERQQSRDKVLLTSYANENDLEMGRDGKIAAIEGTIRITESNITILQRSLQDLTTQAAERERSGQTIPSDVRRDIAAARDMIAKHEAYILTKRREQAELRTQFDSDLIRFRELRAMLEVGTSKPPTPPQQGTIAKKPEHVNQEVATQAIESVTAECSTSCDKAWSLAQHYVQARANTRLQVVTNTRLVTTEPTQPNAISLSVTRVPDQGKTLLVMDILCYNSPEGQKYCHTPAVQAVRDGFKSYIEGH